MHTYYMNVMEAFLHLSCSTLHMLGRHLGIRIAIPVLTWILSHSSARMTRSRMMGVARRESSHVLCSTMVLCPPIQISDVYSSIARLLSPT